MSPSLLPPSRLFRVAHQKLGVSHQLGGKTGSVDMMNFPCRAMNRVVIESHRAPLNPRETKSPHPVITGA
eukprot:14325793-Ditylum_brightwellii.AAC.1